MKADLGATVLEVGLASLDDAAPDRAILDSLGPHTAAGQRDRRGGDRGQRTAGGHDRPAGARRRGHHPTPFNLREPSLDDVFLSLTGHRTEEDEAGEADHAARRQAPAAADADRPQRAMPVATGELA